MFVETGKKFIESFSETRDSACGLVECTRMFGALS